MAGSGKFQLMQKTVFQKIQEPPKTFEEFLKSQNWEYWPRNVRFRDQDILDDAMKKVQEDSSFTSIYSLLWDKVPRIFQEVITMDSRLNECSFLLQNHASKLFDCSKIMSKTSPYAKLEKYKAFLRDHYRQRKIVLSDEMETEKNIEGCDFSGFKQDELPQLPRHLDAKQIYLFILRAYNFEEKVFKIWKTYFLSDASVSLLHDCFWWWFLHKFKPDRKDQDCLFDRISESYVTLFMSIPVSRKDAFFQVYPDCLAQAIYAAFQESFPESSGLFNNDFKEDLGNTIFLWLSAIDFHMTNILKNPRAYATSVLKEESTLSRITTKSHYRSFGPEFYRVLFDFGGQSPLILYYLKVHELVDISSTPKQKKSRLTQILREAPPAPTYRDVIMESKKQLAQNQKDFRMIKQRINEEIKRLRLRQEEIDKEINRLQAKASKNPQEVKTDFENFLHKLRVEEKLEEEFGVSPTPPSSPPSPPSSAASFIAPGD